jgi:hypothetical protein
MNKKMMYASIAVVVIVITVAVGAYLLVNSGGGGGGGGGETKNTYTVANATSLQIEGNETSTKGLVTYKWIGKNLNSTQQMFRLDLWGGESGNYSYIFITSNQTVWLATNGVWTDVSSAYNDQWNEFGTEWTGLVNHLKTNWSGTGDCTFTSSWGASETVYNVSVNPSLADSLFQPNT